MLYRIIVGVIYFWANSLFSYSDEIILTNGRSLFMSSSDPHFLLTQLFKENFESSVSLLSSAISSGDIVFQINPGYGSLFFPLSQAVGEQGMVFAVVSSAEDYYLISNSTQESQTSVNAKLIYAPLHLGHTTIVDFFESPQELSLTSIWKELGAERAVKLLTISQSSSVAGHEYFVLHGAIPFIRHCLPFLYIENNDARRSALIIQLLQSLNYEIFWHISWLIDPDKYRAATFNQTIQSIPPNTASVYLFAIPSGLELSNEAVREHHLIRFTPGRFYLKQVIYMSKK
jgi:hypothetical protein